MSSSTWSPEALKSLPIFSALTDAQLTWLLPTTQRRAFARHSYILHSGETPDGLYVIAAGRVRVTHHDSMSRVFIVEVLGPGELFGEMGLIDATACPASVIAAETCDVAFVPRPRALEILDMSAAAATTLLRVSLQRLCSLHRQIAALALESVYDRVLKVIAANGHEAEGEWHVDVGSEEIAARVGASREMVSRVLRTLIEKRLVRRHKRRLIVIDRERLAASHDKLA